MSLYTFAAITFKTKHQFQPMKKQALLIALLLVTAHLRAQEQKDYQISLSGFVTAESILDTRQTISAREGDVLLFPAPVDKDSNGEDINARMNFNMFSIHSRLRTHVRGPEIFGAKTSALVETDFLGNSDRVISMMRLRHAILKLEWENASLLAGQYWHPFFVTSTYPEVSSWGGGIPYAVLSRNPQFRFSYNFSEAFSGSVTALTQRDFSSPGPNGASPEYLRNSGLPEINLHLKYHSPNLKIGAMVDYKEILPRTTDLAGLKMTKTLAVWQGNAYLNAGIGPFTVKLKGLYGQNMYNFVMMGGYAEFIDVPGGGITYANLVTGSVWSEWIYRAGDLSYSLFGAYTKNMGLTSAPEALDVQEFYGRATDIDHAIRIAPRLSIHKKKFLIMGEVSYDTAAYGTTARDGTVENTTPAENVRFQLHLKYNF